MIFCWLMNRYNPNIHHRRSIRLKGYDYSQEGLYFITICCQDRFHRFGYIENGIMILNEYGKIAHNEWAKLAERYPSVNFDVFVIMPNHMHGIISITGTIGATLAVVRSEDISQNGDNAQNDDISQNDIFFQNDGGAQNSINRSAQIGIGQVEEINNGQPHGIARTVGDIVGAYKSLVANGCLEVYKSKNEKMGKLWQRNYYEHIIRNESAYLRIAEYIINNPQKWDTDKLHKK
jgi:putative transposase